MSVTAFDGRVSTGKEEWLTPPFILEALGEFDLDPCAPVQRPWPTANHHFTSEQDGLTQLWHGRVWLNPPYGNKTIHWMRRMADHNHGIALIFARTETVTFFECVWPAATALLFLKGRLRFFNADGTESDYSGGAPSVLIAYGKSDKEKLLAASLTLKGKFIVP